MAKYASGTQVPVERSRGEIERTLTKYGARQFMYGYDQDRALVAFTLNNRQIRFILEMPRRDSEEVRLTAGGNPRTPSAQRDFYDQLVRQRWRALLLVIKAKLEAVDTGIVSFESEFLAHTMLPSGRTVGEEIAPQIDKAYQTNRMPELLPSLAIEQ